VLNARIRKQWLNGRTTVGLIGQAADLTYAYEHLGDGAAALAGLADSGARFAKALRAAARPAMIIGQGALTRGDGGAVIRAAADIAGIFGVVKDGWNGWNVLHTAAARVGGLDMGFLPREGGMTAASMAAPGALDVLFLLGADELEVARTDAFVAYLGTHGDAGAHRADVILPGAAYTEKDGLYVNTEGRVQRGERAVFPKGEAREDWAILRALSEYVGKPLPYDTLDQLRDRLFADHGTFGQIDYAPGATPTLFDLTAVGAPGDVLEAPFLSPINDFHLTNAIARASVTMAQCAGLAAGAKMAAE
jgi:NADH-quinone oxidoreductase subunit G